MAIGDPGQLTELAERGFDVAEGETGGDSVEVIASDAQAAELEKLGLEPELQRVDGMTATEFAAAAVAADGSYDVYRPYFNDSCDQTTCYVGRDPDTNEPRPTLYQEMLALADEHPEIVQAVEIGRTINNVPILALRVTRDAREASNPPGSKPPSSITPRSTPASGSPRR